MSDECLENSIFPSLDDNILHGMHREAISR